MVPRAFIITEFKGGVKVEVDVLSSPSVIVFTVSVDVNHIEFKPMILGVQERYESHLGWSGLPVPNSPCGFCGRKATLNLN